MKKKVIIVIVAVLLVVIGALCIGYFSHKNSRAVTAPAISFTTLTLKTGTPKTELAKQIGSANVPIVLVINHIDEKRLCKGMVLTIPSAFPSSGAC